ncbi:hypothetical protein NL676_037083 [Syzygium grande]|nr:hypothetical protein NL676_037083 [Syzygium grande]
MEPLTTSQAQAIPPEASKTLRHFLHPHHPLHEALPSHLHPAHPLTLVNQSLGMVCDLCGEDVNGLYYTCGACRFDVHLLCTELPALVEHAVHPHHLLTLSPAESRSCAVCRHVCSSWRYTCEPCQVDLHLECAFQELVVVGQIATAPVSTYGQRQYGHVAGVPSAASPSSFYPYQPVVVYQPIYSAMPIDGGASKSMGGSDKRKKIYSIVAKVAVKAVTKVVVGSITGDFSS